MIEYPETEESVAKLVVIGVGGAGGNAVDTMITTRVKGVEFVAANTDAQALKRCRASRKVQMGPGLGAGSNPDIGREHAEASLEEISGILDGADMAFITSGMGGGTGTGGAPVIARRARDMGILTVGVVTKPFEFEGRRRMRLAEAGLAELKEYVDSLIVIPNQKLVAIAGKSMTFADAFKSADAVLLNAVQGISDLIVRPGMVNVDFADVKAVMSERGMALMGVGVGTGEDRAIKAAQAAVSSPLLDDISIQGARGVLVNVYGPENMSMHEIQEACTKIQEEADEDALIIWGATFDSTLTDEIKFTVIATGFHSFEHQRNLRGVARIRSANLDVPTHVRERHAEGAEVTPIPPRELRLQQRVSPFADEENDELAIPAFIRKRMMM